jgi:hypothetical protein
MTSCSSLARGLAEPLAGSAPTTAAWLALEQPGAWGARAPGDSNLAPDVARDLDARSAGLPIRVVLIRRPGRHPDVGPTGPRTLLVARPGPEPELRRITLPDPRALLDLDLASILTPGPLPGPPDHATVVLVCTNGRRDVCCARNGREAVEQLTRDERLEVWESSHLGGHRFSPTVLQLPDGWLFGGPEAASLSTAACRGRTDLTAGAQAAELAVLAHRGVSKPRPLTTAALPDSAYLVDGVAVRVDERPVGPDRPHSCGGLPQLTMAPLAHLV